MLITKISRENLLGSLHGHNKDVAAFALTDLLCAGQVGPFPAGRSAVDKCRTAYAPFFRATLYFPAGTEVEKLLDPGDTDSHIVDHVAQALYPMDIVF